MAAAGGGSVGLSLWLWGAIVRTVVHCHFTWSVNSVTHLWGYRNYETADNSRNNAIIASSATARAGTTTIMPIPIRRATGTSGGGRRGMANHPFPDGRRAGDEGQNAASQALMDRTLAA